ncbi:Uncharacterized membrane protein YckC, RDD family [Anaerocolumna jejuensis DSM 15929]|uniref:Uncharacterized membrane protein YckC, RDD family n=1 Tax=Anaerocolumna jejuensis DSM 15929 TaxID=1121322 RepID=A0A1M7DDB6_9FIRM|nr:RDD family protein [Anaerocolumna jejuensis]SHL77450.1 Uncharacterized membrane protein YckC, RDD family [Anaerocolumna jejuensis DSM 15929]
MYAGFWKRFVAYLLDAVVISIVFIIFILSWALFELLLDFTGLDQKTKEMVLGVLGVPIILSIPWLYCTLFESSRYQATVGKIQMGIIVVNMDFSRISFARANVRYWSHIFSSILGIGFIIAGFTNKKQALHDYIAQTYVVNKITKL